VNGFLESGVGFAFGLTLLAGLSTGIGSLAALFSRRTNKAFLCAALGFSAGVMVYVSMIEIFAKARLALTGALGLRAGSWATAGAFFAGILLILLIDRLIPSYENPHETHGVEEIWNGPPAEVRDERLVRMGVLTALAIGIHNFPEGLATFVSALQDPALGVVGGRCHRHPQHPRGNRRLGGHLLRIRGSAQSLSLLSFLGAGRTCRGSCRVGAPKALHESSRLRGPFCRGWRHHGLHLP